MDIEMASAVERIRQNTFEVRDKSSKRPRVAAGMRLSYPQIALVKHCSETSRVAG